MLCSHQYFPHWWPRTESETWIRRGYPCCCKYPDCQSYLPCFFHAPLKNTKKFSISIKIMRQGINKFWPFNPKCKQMQKWTVKMVKSYWYLHDLQFDLRIKKNNFSTKKIEKWSKKLSFWTFLKRKTILIKTRSFETLDNNSERLENTMKITAFILTQHKFEADKYLGYI